MNTIVSNNKFKKPYFIPELGEEGLNSYEIATSLGVPIRSINQRMEREWFDEANKLGWTIKKVVLPESHNMLPDVKIEKTVYLFTTKASKAFVATYNNKIGRSYLNFLFACEKIATEETPKLLHRIEQLEAQIVTLETTSKQHKRLINRASKKGMIPSPVFEENLFGKLEARYELKLKSDVDPKLQSLAKLKHISNIQEGLNKQFKKMHDDMLELERQQREINLKLSRGNL